MAEGYPSAIEMILYFVQGKLGLTQRWGQHVKDRSTDQQSLS